MNIELSEIFKVYQKPSGQLFPDTPQYPDLSPAEEKLLHDLINNYDQSHDRSKYKNMCERLIDDCLLPRLRDPWGKNYAANFTNTWFATEYFLRSLAYELLDLDEINRYVVGRFSRTFLLMFVINGLSDEDENISTYKDSLHTIATRVVPLIIRYTERHQKSEECKFSSSMLHQLAVVFLLDHMVIYDIWKTKYLPHAKKLDILKKRYGISENDALCDFNLALDSVSASLARVYL